MPFHLLKTLNNQVISALLNYIEDNDPGEASESTALSLLTDAISKGISLKKDNFRFGV